MNVTGRLNVDGRARRRRIAAISVVTTLAGALAGIAGASGAASAATTSAIYVSPTGNDANSGTSASKPLHTLQHARDVVRKLIPAMTTDITINLAKGKYVLTTPLSLTTADSGINGHKVVWRAATSSAPVISGGVQITGWHVSAAGPGLWEAPAPAGLNTRQLYINNVRAQRASGVLPVTLTPTATGYTASAPTMATWRNPSDIEFVWTGGDNLWSLVNSGDGAWTEPRCPIGSISGTTITMAQPCWDNTTNRPMRTDGSGHAYYLVGPGTLSDNKTPQGTNEIPTYVENAFELLDTPGEWYLDRTAGVIYYKPRPGENLTTEDVEAPVLQQLVTGNGTATTPIHDITFQHVEFTDATWLGPSSTNGFSDIQAGYTFSGNGAAQTEGLCTFVQGGTCPYGNWTKEIGNVSFTYDQRLSFVGDEFAHLGAAGLNLGTGSQSSLVQGNTFTDISGNGIELGGVDIPLPSKTGQHTSDNKILDNHLYSLPVEYHGGVAIWAGYTERSLISHNQIDHTAYTAISLGWGGWPDKIQQPAQPNYSNHNVVSYNRIDHAMQFLSDGGGIYTQGITGDVLANGEQVIGNVVLSNLGHGHAIYTDNGSTNITIKGNVMLGDDNDWGTHHTDYRAGHTGYDPLDVEGNYWQEGDNDSNSKNVTVANNHIIASLADVPSAVVSAAGLEPAYATLGTEPVGSVTAPDAPSHVAAFAVSGGAYVAFQPSYVDHRSTVTSYTVTASPGGATATLPASSVDSVGYVLVSGLTNGTAYTFTVTATNGSGTSAASLPSATITPAVIGTSVPGAVTGVATHVVGSGVRVQWAPPAATGSTPLIGFELTVTGQAPETVAGHWNLAANNTRTLYTDVDLASGSYTISVQALNAVGASAPATVNVTVP